MAATGTAFVDVALAQVIRLVTKYSPDILAGMDPVRPPFTRIGRMYVKQMYASPEAWVSPVRTVFDPEGQLTDSGNTVTVTCGIAGSEPEEMVSLALDYVRAVHLAIESAVPGDWDERVLRVYVQEHDYGVLWTMGAGLAVYPALHLQVDQSERIGQ